MSKTVVFPPRHLRRIIERLLESPPQPVRCSVGIAHLPDGVQYLVRDSPDSITPYQNGSRTQCLMVSVTAREPDENTLNSPLQSEAALAHLVFGQGAMEGQIWGRAKMIPGSNENHSRSWAAIDGILLPGPGFDLLQVNSPPSSASSDRRPAALLSGQRERWSRTIGALGLQVWQRLTSLKIAIVGCGRTGSLIATTLARMGVRDLTLIDPDTVEEHNLGEMDGISEADLGRNKAEAMAEFLRGHCVPNFVGGSFVAVAEPISTAYRAALTADVLFSCVDNDAARLSCGIIATLFHKVLLDVGTGVFEEAALTSSAFSTPQTIKGADIRLLFPAEGCLVCFGNLAHYESALAELVRGKRNPSTSRQPWWQQRQGSLRTLNMLAASIAVQMLCDLVARQIQSSTWSRVQSDSSGAMQVEQIVRQASEPVASCPLCLRTGLGSDGISWRAEESFEVPKLFQADGR